MPNINLSRVEERYLAEDFSALVDSLIAQGFEEQAYGDTPITLTYFCDSMPFRIQEEYRIKIRTYATEVPKEINKEATYKLNFKIDRPGVISTKESFEGDFDALVQKVKSRVGDDIRPLMAIAYRRKHFILPNREDMRVTFDEDIFFYRIEEDKLIQFYHYDVNLFEVKYDPTSEEAIEIKERVLEPLQYSKAVSKKDVLYAEYVKVFGV